MSLDSDLKLRQPLRHKTFSHTPLKSQNKATFDEGIKISHNLFIRLKPQNKGGYFLGDATRHRQNVGNFQGSV